jgi:hypothetical protein
MPQNRARKNMKTLRRWEYREKGLGLHPFSKLQSPERIIPPKIPFPPRRLNMFPLYGRMKIRASGNRFGVFFFFLLAAAGGGGENGSSAPGSPSEPGSKGPPPTSPLSETGPPASGHPKSSYKNTLPHPLDWENRNRAASTPRQPRPRPFASREEIFRIGEDYP